MLVVFNSKFRNFTGATTATTWFSKLFRARKSSFWQGINFLLSSHLMWSQPIKMKYLILAAVAIGFFFGLQVLNSSQYLLTSLGSTHVWRYLLFRNAKQSKCISSKSTTTISTTTISTIFISTFRYFFQSVYNSSQESTQGNQAARQQSTFGSFFSSLFTPPAVPTVIQ